LHLGDALLDRRCGDFAIPILPTSRAFPLSRPDQPTPRPGGLRISGREAPQSVAPPDKVRPGCRQWQVGRLCHRPTPRGQIRRERHSRSDLSRWNQQGQRTRNGTPAPPDHSDHPAQTATAQSLDPNPSRRRRATTGSNDPSASLGGSGKRLQFVNSYASGPPALAGARCWQEGGPRLTAKDVAAARWAETTHARQAATTDMEGLPVKRQGEAPVWIGPGGRLVFVGVVVDQRVVGDARSD
jgi:hypothetical protein